MEAMPNSLPKPITENPLKNSIKGAKTSNEDNNEISENEMNRNSKIQNSVNSRIKSEMKGIKNNNNNNNNNKELKWKFGGKIDLNSKIENSKTVLGKTEKDLDKKLQPRESQTLSETTKN